MDLGIRGRTAIVCGASKGLGLACATHLAREGADLVLVARSVDALESAAAELSCAFGVGVRAVCADVASEAGRTAVLAACPAPDILVNNGGGPPAGDFRKFTRADWIAALDLNMLSAIELIRQTIDPMIARGFGRIVNITSAAMRVPLPILPLSNGARGGLTAMVGGLAPTCAAHNVTINNLLPGPFDTDRLKQTIRAAAEHAGTSEAEMRAQRLGANPSRRAGQPEELGAMCAFLCSQWSGYITGQNILMDGGANPTAF
ncbi:3-oxoacyl-ACP reductase [Pseudomonas aeruginosa]|uniref:SDR family oxidoreductase n=1 Tax=Pseudomonas aeruginosa TaxID=287 RepID=UPI00053E8CD6|nr:SDR family oxidoreductase [Pseudomonas aeruginosa]MBI8147160.1 SDR family oxidoreductase [Pseudomonas aeruginosa]OFB99777.1 3-oxoacyl-ACP reductase [Pseudomonas aeruginosa]RQG67476.1 3-oxoacyl-ACP reductase [Pseudomonas aeruginosa]RTW70025.1 SDR family oxidoreductase [Pseudomonas aeruginosa]WCX90460.1 SDR family oxidoreductase [Pseudomonas aeruginosa]